MAQHSLVVQGCFLCVCKCYQEVDDGETRRPVISLSLFIPSLNSRAATEANGVLIYSWMTHTCHLLGFLHRQETFLCLMSFYSMLSYTHADDLRNHGITLFTFHSFGIFPKVSYFFFRPHRKIFGVQYLPQGHHVDGSRKKLINNPLF